jgi:hypothetical protein
MYENTGINSTPIHVCVCVCHIHTCTCIITYTHTYIYSVLHFSSHYVHWGNPPTTYIYIYIYIYIHIYIQCPAFLISLRSLGKSPYNICIYTYICIHIYIYTYSVLHFSSHYVHWGNTPTTHTHTHTYIYTYINTVSCISHLTTFTGEIPLQLCVKLYIGAGPTLDQGTHAIMSLSANGLFSTPCMYSYACMCVCVYICKHACMYTYIHSMHTNIYIYMHICTYSIK